MHTKLLWIKRSFIHVCLLITLFSILVFGCLESDDRSCLRLRYCSLVNNSVLNKIEALQAMKRCTAKWCYVVVNFSVVMFLSQPFTAYGVFFCAINPTKSVRRYNSNMHLHYSAVNSWLTIPTLPQSDDNLGKVEAISVLNAREWGCPKRCDTQERLGTL